MKWKPPRKRKFLSAPLPAFACACSAGPLYLFSRFSLCSVFTVQQFLQILYLPAADFENDIVIGTGNAVPVLKPVDMPAQPAAVVKHRGKLHYLTVRRLPLPVPPLLVAMDRQISHGLCQFPGLFGAGT